MMAVHQLGPSPAAQVQDGCLSICRAMIPNQPLRMRGPPLELRQFFRSWNARPSQEILRINPLAITEPLKHT